MPRAAEIDRELRSTAGQIVAAAFRRGADPTSALSALQERNLSLQRERAELLVENGMTLIEYDQSFFDEILAIPAVQDLYKSIDNDTNGLASILQQELAA